MASNKDSGSGNDKNSKNYLRKDSLTQNIQKQSNVGLKRSDVKNQGSINKILLDKNKQEKNLQKTLKKQYKK